MSAPTIDFFCLSSRGFYECINSGKIYSLPGIPIISGLHVCYHVFSIFNVILKTFMPPHFPLYQKHFDFVCLSLPQCQHSSQRGPQAKCVSGINYGCHRAKLPQYLRWGIRPSMYLRRKTNAVTILPRATCSVDTCDYLVS